MDVLFEFIVFVVLSCVFFPLGKVAIWLFTAGRMKSQSFSAASSEQVGFAGCGIKRDDTGRLVASECLTEIIGAFAFVVSVLVLLTVFEALYK